MRIQAVLTPQWLQIDGYLFPNNPSTGFLVSIFTVGINSKSFPGMYAPYKKAIPTFFANVQREWYDTHDGERGLITSSGHAQVIQ